MTGTELLPVGLTPDISFVVANNLPRSEGIPCGWCAVSGQGQSAYVEGGFQDDDSFGGDSVSSTSSLYDKS